MVGFAACATAAFIVACEPTSGNLTDTSPSAVTAGTADAADGGRRADTSSVATIASAPLPPDCSDRPAATASRRDQVCYRWRCEGRDVAPALWSGNAASCNAGALDEDAAKRALRIVNLHRFVADVDPVKRVPSWTAPAQACALLAHANAKLSHEPPRDWACWTEASAFTSSVSLIANRSAPIAIGAFIEDPGNEVTMVHRRWLLTENLRNVGLGSTDRYACVIVDGSSFGLKAADGANTNDDREEDEDSASSSPDRGWVAWPPNGPVPLEMLAVERVDEVGWTVQSSTNDLDSASVKVTVTMDGVEDKPVHVSHLTPLFGSRSAIRFTPDGWTTQAGHRYAVRVKAEATKIEYVVEPSGC